MNNPISYVKSQQMLREWIAKQGFTKQHLDWVQDMKGYQIQSWVFGLTKVLIQIWPNGIGFSIYIEDAHVHTENIKTYKFKNKAK